MTDKSTSEEKLKDSEEVAFGLTRAAVLLDQAKQDRSDSAAMATALGHNLELWIALRAMVDRKESAAPEVLKENLIRLSNFVADTTFKSAEGELEDSAIETLININLQISEGFLEGMNSA